MLKPERRLPRKSTAKDGLPVRWSPTDGIAWQRELPGYGQSALLVDERGVYAFFESGDCVAVDRAGRPLWHRDLTADYGSFDNNHGLGSWWADVEREEWPESADDCEKIVTEFVFLYGDRRQELVFIGIDREQQLIESILNACLLTDEEFECGPVVWSAFQDPFPAAMSDA